MSTILHRAYVISDLHLGGRFPASGGGRGFRMMDRPDALASFIRGLAAKPVQPTIELIINGDFVDFLAEETDDGRWKPFRDEPGEAVAAFEVLAGRKEDGEVFEALAGLVDAGHRLTILIGNHDIELTWPEVRAAFERRLWTSSAKKTGAFNLRWIHDGEALVVGDALIEHGNRYDPANFVDHESLRRVRELRSRRLYGREGGIFHPPVGSRLVADVMNPVKKEYPFIDLLKPESEPLFGLLLALDPSQRRRLDNLARSLLPIPLNLVGPAADPGYRQRISGSSAAAGISRGPVASGKRPKKDDPLVALLSRTIPADDVAEANKALEMLPREQGDEIARGRIASFGERAGALYGLLGLVVSKKDDDIKNRLPLLRHAVRALRGDQTFEESIETGKRYIRAARQLALGEKGIKQFGKAPVGFRFVIFGHTHHRKTVDLVEEAATYVNTGTWARLMKFPDDLVSDDDAIVTKALGDFVESIQAGTYKTEFIPTYARVDVKDGGYVERVELLTYDPTTGKVE
ncbi:hypothetical protein sce2284 [Sorangium cellulosum So ce56]|uniref:Calcineurin-like phosphoesterase domain-containing protein n=1 Tax=Sorangium cellulosum (strain So ce56) TaxID=448385 RepID=A9G0W2_SORC5|nr:metallophosphoesterase [Sorangium cellulosum]CAN92443.1 hypothetical protein sce2284 [Sorangium cellulosum So ce56]